MLTMESTEVIEAPELRELVDGIRSIVLKGELIHKFDEYVHNFGIFRSCLEEGYEKSDDEISAILAEKFLNGHQ